jgi:hypothetical protein
MSACSATWYFSSDDRYLGSHTYLLPDDAKPAPAVAIWVRIVPPEAEADCLEALANGRCWDPAAE